MKRREFIQAAAGAIGAAALPFVPGMLSAGQETQSVKKAVKSKEWHKISESIVQSAVPRKLPFQIEAILPYSNRQKRYQEYAKLQDAYVSTLDALVRKVNDRLTILDHHIMLEQPSQEYISHYKTQHFSYSFNYCSGRWSIIRNLCVYGDQFLRIQQASVPDDDGLPHYRLIDLPEKQIYRIEDISNNLVEFQCDNSNEGPDFIAVAGLGDAKQRKSPVTRFIGGQNLLHLRLPLPCNCTTCSNEDLSFHYPPGYHPYGWSVINDLQGGKNVLRNEYVATITTIVHRGLMNLPKFCKGT